LQTAELAELAELDDPTEHHEAEPLTQTPFAITS
jgi:hypothetical protein